MENLTPRLAIDTGAGGILPQGELVSGISNLVRARTGWILRGVPGYIPAKAFFACLAAKKLPVTVLIRPREVMDYLPEPDIFHDLFGRAALLLNPQFAEILAIFGEIALKCEDEEMIKKLGRLYWHLIEHGLILSSSGVKIYGANLVTSHGEAQYALTGDWEDPHNPVSDVAAREVPVWRQFDLERVMNTDFEIDHYQPVYYVLQGFDQLLDALKILRGQVLGS